MIRSGLGRFTACVASGDAWPSACCPNTHLSLRSDIAEHSVDRHVVDLRVGFRDHGDHLWRAQSGRHVASLSRRRSRRTGYLRARHARLSIGCHHWRKSCLGERSLSNAWNRGFFSALAWARRDPNGSQRVTASPVASRGFLAASRHHRNLRRKRPHFCVFRDRTNIPDPFLLTGSFPVVGFLQRASELSFNSLPKRFVKVCLRASLNQTFRSASASLKKANRS